MTESGKGPGEGIVRVIGTEGTIVLHERTANMPIVIEYNTLCQQALRSRYHDCQHWLTMVLREIVTRYY